MNTAPAEIEFSDLRGDALLAAPYAPALSKDEAKKWLEAMQPKKTLGLPMLAAFSGMDRDELVNFLSKVKSDSGSDELTVVFEAVSEAQALLKASVEVADKMLARILMGIHVVCGFKLEDTCPDDEEPG